jgi:predicted nuclease of predicted toxin-antitoxin system
MIGRLLIDECMSPELVPLAIDAGHIESTCVRDRGRLGLKDWELMEYVIQQDFILVTRNAQDFRGARGFDFAWNRRSKWISICSRNCLSTRSIRSRSCRLGSSLICSEGRFESATASDIGIGIAAAKMSADVKSQIVKTT